MHRSFKSIHNQASEKSATTTVFQKLDKRSSNKLLLNFKTQEPRDHDSKDASIVPISFMPGQSGHGNTRSSVEMSIQSAVALQPNHSVKMSDERPTPDLPY